MADRALHIGVDGRELIGRPTGVGRYLRRVLDAWTTTPGWPHRLTVFLHADPPAPLRQLAGVDWRIERSASGGTVWEQTRLARAVTDARLDTFFAVGYTAPLRLPCPFVVVVHDVSFFTHPEWFSWREGLRRRWLTKSAARRARTVLTVSNFSAEEIARTLGVPRDRIRLAPPGPPPGVSAPDHRHDRLVLYVGSMFNRRHVVELVDAFPEVLRSVPDARLVLAGSDRSVPRLDPVARAAALGITHAVEWREYVDDGELSRLYGRARAFAFLSEYEGFAMTPMEALAHGVPPVLLDTPVAREVYGPGALFVRLERREVARALVSLLTEESTRTAILAAGRERLAAFSWARTAGVIRDALERSVPAR